MDTQLSHLEEYKMLREEIMQYIRDLYRTQLAGAVAAGTIYTWLLSNKQALTSRAVWFIAPFVILVCAIYSLYLVLKMNSIAGYLRRIEEHAFGQDAMLPGWERYHYHRRNRFNRASFVLATVLWSLATVGSMFASWLLSR